MMLVDREGIAPNGLVIQQHRKVDFYVKLNLRKSKLFIYFPLKN